VSSALSSSATTVRSIALAGPRTLTTLTLPLPDLSGDGALLRIEACGVCGSDIPPYETGIIDGVDSSKHPVVLGHEMVGRIEAIGPLAARRWGVDVGDRVVAERAIPCGHCETCLSGSYPMCKRPGYGDGLYRYGSTPASVGQGLWGGFAEMMYLHPDSTVFRASPDVDPEHLAFFTPLSNGLSWTADAGQVRMGQTVVIQGPGQQGLACVIGAVARGAEQIIVTGLAQDAARLEAAKFLGATDVVLVGAGVSAVEQVRELTGGRGAHAVFDTTSGTSTRPVEDAVGFAADGGRIVLATGHEEGARLRNFDVERFWRNRLTMVGVRSRSRWAVSAALTLIASGRVPMDAIPSLSLPLDDLEHGLKVMLREADADNPAVHVTVKP
jgi:threonine dehydrogenase-like Zn-dependent dehydrogenase